MLRDTSERIVIDAGGSRTAVHAYGPAGGPGILAVHGFRGTHYGLEPLAATLASQGYRVLVPDLPGAGDSSPLDGIHNAAAYGAWLAELTQQVPRQHLLLGHSFGSVVVGSAIAQGAEHSGVVLVNPILTSPLKGPRQIATAVARAYYALAGCLPHALGHRLLASKFVAGIGGSLMTSTADPALRKWIRAEHLRQAGAFASRDIVLESFAASTLATVADFAGSMSSPTLVLGGDRDPISPPKDYTAQTTRIPHGTFHIFPGRGHLLPYEETHEVSQLISRWDRSLTRGLVG